jgi:hypothetical protein
VADNIFSFYYDGVNAVVYDANEKIVVPPTPAPAAPGKLGDVVNAINTAEISPTGNFIIYFKMTTGSTVAFQSGKNNAAAPAFSWTDSTNVAYLVTTAVAGSNFWSQVTVLNTDLKTYNWWVPGTGTGKNFKADNAMLTASPFYITAANADNVALAK